MKINKLSIIIPVYNEEVFIESVVDEVVLATSLGLKKEIIIVIKNKYKDIKIIHQKKNSGKGSAIKCGLLQSTGDIVLIQDSDREYSPSDYPLLLTPFFKYGADVVYGSRLSTSQAHRVLYFWHYQLNQLLTFLSNILTNLNLTDMETGFKVFRGEIIRKIAPELQSKRFGFEPEITARLAKKKGIKIFEVGISYSGRTYQEGKKIGWKDGVLALWEIIKYNLF